MGPLIAQLVKDYKKDARKLGTQICNSLEAKFDESATSIVAF